MSSGADVDVLIAGAGPVGLTLSGELARHGVSFRIVTRVCSQHTPAGPTRLSGYLVTS